MSDIPDVGDGPDVVEGTVARRHVGTGSKSERDAVVIDAGDVTYLLRSRDGNAFDDPALDPLVGHRSRAQGRLVQAGGDDKLSPNFAIQLNRHFNLILDS